MLSKQTWKQFLHYNLIGIVNTLFGFTLVFVLMFSGVEALTSNAIGYALGGLLSYGLNSKYTFKGSTHTMKRAFKFFTVLLIAYALNWVLLSGMLEMGYNPYLSQVVSGCLYTCSAFVLMKKIVFS